jgi:hypothetical protein
MAESMIKQHSKSEIDDISADYRVAKNKCSSLLGSAKSIFIVEAKKAKASVIADAKSEKKTSKTCSATNSKTVDTNPKEITKERAEDNVENESVLAPFESQVIPLGKDFFKGRKKSTFM